MVTTEAESGARQNIVRVGGNVLAQNSYHAQLRLQDRGTEESSLSGTYQFI